jgi:hypothetical protein
MWQQEFTWFFALFHHEFRQGNRIAFECSRYYLKPLIKINLYYQ